VLSESFEACRGKEALRSVVDKLIHFIQVTGVDVMITIFGDFLSIFGKKLTFFHKLAAV
jgi:hypothetical protein